MDALATKPLMTDIRRDFTALAKVLGTMIEMHSDDPVAAQRLRRAQASAERVAVLIETRLH